MSSKTNKPDISDLKARLGLNKATQSQPAVAGPGQSLATPAAPATPATPATMSAPHDDLADATMEGSFHGLGGFDVATGEWTAPSAPAAPVPQAPPVARPTAAQHAIAPYAPDAPSTHAAVPRPSVLPAEPAIAPSAPAPQAPPVTRSTPAIPPPGPTASGQMRAMAAPPAPAPMASQKNRAMSMPNAPSAPGASGSRPAQASAQVRAVASPVEERPKPVMPRRAVEDDTPIAEPPMFSAPVVGLLVAMLAVGLGFGYLTSKSFQQRALYDAQTGDAEKIRTALKPKLEGLDAVVPKLEALAPASVDFESAKALSEADFTVNGNILTGGRILLGPDVVDALTTYLTEATLLKRMLADHNRLTNTVDRDELQQLAAGNAAVERGMVAVVYNYKDVVKRAADPAFQPAVGRLVTVESLERDAEGKLEFKFLNTDRRDKVEFQGLIPLNKEELMKTSGDNALQRYTRRVREIQDQARRVAQHVPRLREGLNGLADRPAAPLLKLSAD